MTDVNLEGLRQRQHQFKWKKEKGTFTEVGKNWVVFLDDHHKLVGFTINTASQKILFLKVWTSNSNPIFVGQWYFKARYFQLYND